MNFPASYFTERVVGQFLPENFPEIDKEIGSIRTQVGKLRNADHCAVMISYFKDHKIRIDLAQAQSMLVHMLLSMSDCRHIEGLFEASRDNEQFSNAFEIYLLKELSL